ncbi:MAG: tol-pal system YbgF family protein, partial [Pseudobdellovibrionaceae bacterium]
MKKTIGILISSILLAGCASLRSNSDEGGPIDPRVRAEQEGELKKAELAFEKQNYNEAEDLFGEFQAKFPNSIFYQRAQFGRAKSLEALEHWSEAADLYRKTLEVTRARQPQIAAQALYHISFCYENLGDEARVLASLKDALSMKEHLTPEQAQAEIPARMAASLNRMGQTKDAEQYFRQASQGIQQ